MPYTWKNSCERNQDGTWKKYIKKSVKKLGGFGGWKKIIDLADECLLSPYYEQGPDFLNKTIRAQMRTKLRRRDRNLIAALFLTGGRISEVLMLRKNNFDIRDEFILVEKMALLKRIKVEKELIDVKDERPTGEERRHYDWNRKKDVWERYERTYTPLAEERFEFPIPRWELLTDELIEYIDDADEWLFPTDSKKVGVETNPGIQLWIKEKFEIEGRAWISPTRAYQIVRSVGYRLNKEHIWDHWFRGQRASQLRSQYKFGDPELCRFFGWEVSSDSMPQLYGGLSWGDLWYLMVSNKDDVIKKMRL